MTIRITDLVRADDGASLGRYERLTATFNRTPSGWAWTINSEITGSHIASSAADSEELSLAVRNANNRLSARGIVTGAKRSLATEVRA